MSIHIPHKPSIALWLSPPTGHIEPVSQQSVRYWWCSSKIKLTATVSTVSQSHHHTFNLVQVHPPVVAHSRPWPANPDDGEKDKQRKSCTIFRKNCHPAISSSLYLSLTRLVRMRRIRTMMRFAFLIYFLETLSADASTEAPGLLVGWWLHKAQCRAKSLWLSSETALYLDDDSMRWQIKFSGN